MIEDAALLESDRDARTQALDVQRSFIVQAPAGSGKTELLIQRYLRLLATVDEPEEILAITFTRKAAAEMRLRVVDALEAARAGRTEEAPHRRLTLDAAAAVLKRNDARQWGLIENPGRMRILTIDALNAAIARMLPLTARGGGTATVAVDSEMQSAYIEAAAATLDWLGADDETGRAVRNVLEHLDSNTNIYIGQLARMLGSRDQWLPFVRSGRLSAADAESLRLDFEQCLEEIVRDRIRSVHDGVPRGLDSELPPLAAHAAASHSAAGNVDSIVCLLADARALPGTAIEDLPRWLGIAELLLTKDGRLRRAVDKRTGFPPGDSGEKAAMQAVLAGLAECPAFVAALAALRELPPVRYADEQWAVLLSLFRLLPVATYELHRVCMSRGITDHIEVAMSAAHAVGTPDEPGNVALLLDYTLRHILVDEMQDTSKAQYRMLEALTAGWEPGDGRTLFCVGDPMQSIYRFRNAEVMQFVLARHRGIGGVRLEPLLLRQNFRSGEHLVHWFNATFAAVLPAADDPVDGAVSYSASAAAPALLGQGRVVVHPGFGGSIEQEAAAGARLVQAISVENPEDTVAVLVRSRTQLPALLRHLRARGVDYQSVDIDRLTDLPEVLDVLALTRSLAHPGDRVAWLGLLRSPWIALDWTDLHALVSGAGDRTVLELWRDPERLARLSGAGRAALSTAMPVLEAALVPGRAERLHERVERCWHRLGGPALLPDADAVENVHRYLATLARLETAGTLADVAELHTLLDAERVSASSGARLQIMTMHKAKGLQFDHVVLYATGRTSASNQPSILSWIDLPGTGAGVEKLMSPIGRRDELERDPLHRFVERTETAKDRHERARLLYVACTRARKSLHISGQVPLKDDGETFGEPRKGSLLGLLWPAVESEFAGAFAGREAGGAAVIDPVFVAPPFRRLARPWQYPPIEPLRGATATSTENEPEVRVEYDWVGIEARLAGTIVHRWLQRMAESGVPAAGELPAGFADACGRWLAELGASPARHPGIVERVRNALDRVTRDDRGRWLLRGDGAAELQLSGVHDGRLHSIVIDRVRIDEEGTHWIVDYKTSSHEGGDLDGFLRAERERYRAQLDRYAAIYSSYAAAPVRCGLYFPLLARFIEL